MSLEDLQEQGILLPEEKWGTRTLDTPVRRAPLLVAFLAAGGGCLLAYLGDGKLLTWIGVGCFFASFYVLIWLCNQAVQRQRRRRQQS